MKRKKQFLIIHCTATPEGRGVSENDIRTWHTAPKPTGNGWQQVGYTDMITLDGTVINLVPNNDDGYVDPWEITNGAVGKNSISRSIVYVGGLATDGRTAKDTRTAAQRATLARYVKSFHAKHPTVRIIGHNEVAKKACPSFNVQTWLKQIGIKNPS